MEQICESLKRFLIENTAPYIEKAQDEKTPMSVFEEKNITIGYVDTKKYSYSQQIFIVPDQQNFEGHTLDSEMSTSNIDVLLFVRGASDSVLYRQAMRYTAAIKKSVMDNMTLNKAVIEAAVKDIEYFDDVEAVGGGVKAVKLSFLIKKAIEYTEVF